MNRLNLITIVIITAFNTACGQTKESNIATVTLSKKVNWDTFNNDGYSINYPADWELNQSGQMGTSFILFSQFSSTEDDFKDNVNLMIQDLTGHNITLDDYVQISEYQIKTLVTNGKLLSSERVKGEKADYQRVVYTGTQGIYDLKFEQFYWVIENSAYILTLTCKDVDFDSFVDVGEEILESFKIKGY